MAGGTKNNRECGARFERECKNEAIARGLSCRKHAMSGSLNEKGDITITAGFDGSDWVGECKWRKEMPQWFVDCLGDHNFAVFKEARGKKLVVLPWQSFLDLLQ